MSREYDLTVDRLHEILGKISEAGRGDDLISVAVDNIGQSTVLPVSEVFCGRLKHGDGRLSYDEIIDGGLGFTFLSVGNAMPKGFWRDQLKGPARVRIPRKSRFKALKTLVTGR